MSNNLEETNNIYKTSDLYLTAFLKLKNHSYKIEKSRNRLFFLFEESDELTRDVNDFLLGNTKCDALSYSNSIKNLKNFIYNNK
tara:strand:+ start:3110 stop:3361 length:252 start_codon:yes stop_codon:yes gene_type:complete